jgi:hypothetical protein
LPLLDSGVCPLPWLMATTHPTSASIFHWYPSHSVSTPFFMLPLLLYVSVFSTCGSYRDSYHWIRQFRMTFSRSLIISAKILLHISQYRVRGFDCRPICWSSLLNPRHRGSELSLRQTTWGHS